LKTDKEESLFLSRYSVGRTGKITEKKEVKKNGEQHKKKPEHGSPARNY